MGKGEEGEMEGERERRRTTQRVLKKPHTVLHNVF